MQNTRSCRKFLCGSLYKVAELAPAQRGGRADASYWPQAISMSKSRSRRLEYAATEEVDQLTKSVPHPDHLIVLLRELINPRLPSSSRIRGGQDRLLRRFQGAGCCCKALVLELRKSDDGSGRFYGAKLAGPSSATAIDSSDARLRPR